VYHQKHNNPIILYNNSYSKGIDRGNKRSNQKKISCFSYHNYNFIKRNQETIKTKRPFKELKISNYLYALSGEKM